MCANLKKILVTNKIYHLPSGLRISGRNHAPFLDLLELMLGGDWLHAKVVVGVGSLGSNELMLQLVWEGLYLLVIRLLGLGVERLCLGLQTFLGVEGSILCLGFGARVLCGFSTVLLIAAVVVVEVVVLAIVAGLTITFLRPSVMSFRLSIRLIVSLALITIALWTMVPVALVWNIIVSFTSLVALVTLAVHCKF